MTPGGLRSVRQPTAQAQANSNTLGARRSIRQPIAHAQPTAQTQPNSEEPQANSNTLAARRSIRQPAAQAQPTAQTQPNSEEAQANSNTLGARRSIRQHAAHAQPTAQTQSNSEEAQANSNTLGARRSIRQPAAQAQPTAQTQPNSEAQEATMNDVDPADGKRKKTRNKFFKKYRKTTNVKPRIVIEEGMMTPVGEWSQAFITEVNIICRQFAPLSCHDWRTLKKDQKVALFHDRIKERFDIDFHLEHVEKAVNKYLGIRLRDYRCKLHKYYKKFGRDDRLRRSKPYSGVSHEDWEDICDWFQSDEFQKLSAQNSANRQKLEVNHCAGSVSFARFRHSKCDPETRQPLGRIDLYRETHFSDKRSRWVAPLAQERYDDMVTRQTQVISENSTAPVDEDAICDQVLGKRKGYSCGLGHGVMPKSSSSSSTYNNLIVEELKRNAEESSRRLEEAERRMIEAERRAIEAERRNDELNAGMRDQARKLDMLEGWKDKMDAFMSNFGPSF